MPGGWQGELDERGRGLSGVSVSAWCWPAPSPPPPRSWSWSSRPRPSTPTPRRGSRSGSPACAPAVRRSCAVSPLWLHRRPGGRLADDRVVADGHHDDLLAHDQTYRAVVARVWNEERPTCSTPRPPPGRTTAVTLPPSTRGSGPRSTRPRRAPSRPGGCGTTSGASRRPSRESSRHPERGLAVAGDRAVLRFARTLVAERRRAFVALVLLTASRAATGLVVPKRWATSSTSRRRRRRWPRPGRAAGRGRRDPAGALHLLRPADLDDLRAGPARVRTGVHRPHHPRRRSARWRAPAPATRHAGDARRRHHEPGGAVRRADGDHLCC